MVLTEGQHKDLVKQLEMETKICMVCGSLDNLNHYGYMEDMSIGLICDGCMHGAENEAN